MGDREATDPRAVDATVSSCDGDLSVTVGPLGGWFPNDAQLQCLREVVRAVVLGVRDRYPPGVLSVMVQDALLETLSHREEPE